MGVCEVDTSIWRTLRSPQYFVTCALAFLVSTFVTTLVLIHTMEHPRSAIMPRGAPARSSEVRAQTTVPTAAQEQPADQMAAVRFRVVSEPLLRPVAAQRLRDLSGQGIPAFVRPGAGDLVQLQYGAYRDYQNAEADAERLRARGYAALLIPFH
jgi:hypothetical protein